MKNLKRAADSSKSVSLTTATHTSARTRTVHTLPAALVSVSIVMTTVDLEGEVDTDGVLVVHTPGGDERYQLTRLPKPTFYLVQSEKQKILQDLSLQSVFTDLDLASELLFLAYLGVVGTGLLQARISNRQKELADLCSECVVTMTAISACSHNVLERLLEAYSYLLEANEKRALRILSRCADIANTMATRCDKLAHGFGKLKDDTKEDAANATIAWHDQVEKVKELQNLRNEMEANRKQQEGMRNDLNERIAELQTAIAKEEAREDAQRESAFIGQIVGAIAGAIGAGLGAYTSVMVPVKMPQRPGGTEVSGDTEPTPEQLKRKAEAEKADKEAVTAEANARKAKQEVDRNVFDAESDMKAKQTLLDTTKKADQAQEGYEDKVREAQTALDASSTILSKLQIEQKQAEEDLRRAAKSTIDAQAALSAAAAALNNITETTKHMAQEQADRAKELANNRIEMLKQKRELEMARRDAVGQLASLTSRLESNTRTTNVAESAQTALEIATWALDNIYVSLSNAKYFWDSMQRFCENLGKDEVRNQINDEIEDESSPEERIKFYKGPRFVHIGISYICKWTALASVCDEYVVASQKARRSVLDHIGASPNEEEARKLIEPLKQKLKAELRDASADSKVKIDALDSDIRAAAEKA